MSTSSSQITITTRWDRPAVPTGKGETWLVVSVKSRKRRSTTRRQPVDVSFVIDRSGSMNGAPLGLARRGVLEALPMLKESDRFGVVAYDHNVMEIVPLVPASEFNKRHARNLVSGIESGGSTNLCGGWASGSSQLRFAEPSGARSTVRRVILLTDGLANVGVTHPSSIAQHVSAARAQGIATSTLGLGNTFDAELLSGMAESGGGNFAYVEHARDLPAFFARELNEALAIVATGATLTLTLPKGIRAELLNPFPVTRSGKQLTIAVGDIPAGIKLDLVFRVTSRAKVEGPVPAIDLGSHWRGIDSDQDEHAHSILDPIMVLNPVDFAAMPRDRKASEAVAELVAAQAKREAIRQFRDGNSDAARTTLVNARHFAASSPLIRATLLSEIDTMQGLDPNQPEFETIQRQIVNNEHRRTRGRDL